ncbi:MAG: hypothetical protein L3K03_08940 [Thermoplasmata archaeon]|nr:hypothetical protein [Thermoplasmata archaeon]
MAGSLPWSTTPPPPLTNDPNELLRRMDQNIQQMFHWVRLGFIAVIILLVVVVFIG